MNRAFKGVWIPKEIWLSEDLTLQEKVFLVEIDSLDNEEGCFANNKYFADFFQLSKSRVSQIISNLEKKELINVNYLYKTNSKEIDRRIIRINEEGLTKILGIKNIKGGIKEIKEGIKYPKDPPLENANDNNINNNNINNNINKISSNTPKRSLFSAEKGNAKEKAKIEKFVLDCCRISDEFEFDSKVSDKLVDFFRMLGQQGTFLPEVTIRAQLEELYTFKPKEQMTIISDTIRSGWKSLRYAAEKVSKQETPSFDTSKPGSFQPKDPKNDRRAEQYKDDEVF